LGKIFKWQDDTLYGKVFKWLDRSSKIVGWTHVGIPGITRIRRYRLRRKNPIRNLGKTLLLTAQDGVSKVKASLISVLSS
jgi:hypothetical protein